ncbi:protein PRRC2C isoform X1 [Euwallacea similis]|uniref:protein PRRC2C isoform X1 n=1 Tax=Euwallacea similis TaxID=1736056 RepID=UPI00344C1B10
MSTLPGNASKGEKSKPKFQSLDINSLYKISRGENTEKPAQKSSSSYIKHGMQSLGKVPNARRAPANLPSLKSEHHDSGSAVPLVPPGSTGWGKQEQGGAPPSNVSQNGSPPNQVPTPAPQGPPQLTPHQQAIAIPSTNIIPLHNKPTTAIPAQPVNTSSGDKLWSAVMAGSGTGQQDGGHPPAYQSVQFQHEFPSLSAGDGAAAGAPRSSDYVAGAHASANQHGLSLRPQTEGSWTQGGQRAADGSTRSVSAPLGAPPQLGGPGGRLPETVPPQMRGVLPPFMYKGSFPQGTPPAGPVTHPQPLPHNGGRTGRPPRLQDREGPSEDVVPRPIIREEELNKLDEIGHDMGWATSDDIDYNQKLAFSDDEERPVKREQKQGKERQTPPKHWNQPREGYRGRQSDDEDVLVQKHRQHQKEIDLAIQRAKQRKEEEEKRFNEESRQRARRKLQELDEKVREKRDRDRESEIGTISPSAVPPKPINHVEIPLPEFQKEKEQKSEVAAPQKEESGFRQLTQIEGKTFSSRKPQTKPEREHRDQNGPSFSRQFQSDLPPRFLKQQRPTSTATTVNQSQYQYDTNRWTAPRAPSRGRPESPDKPEEERREFKRQSSEDSYRSSQDYTPLKVQEGRYVEESYMKKEEDRWHNKTGDKKHDYEEKRPQRPDSRDSHTSHSSQGSLNRRSRDSDLKESMGSWNEDVEAAYEEKREKERVKEEKRSVPSLVPGPITRDRIEAEDINEKRALTQLKKGEMPATKTAEVKKEKIAWPENPSHQKSEIPKSEEEVKPSGKKLLVEDKERLNRGRNNNSTQGNNNNWGGSDYHSRGGPWTNKRPSRWGAHKPGGREFYGTDSDGSTDAYSAESKDSSKSKKPMEKDEKNRDNKQTLEQKRHQEKPKENYVPRGEPSRHGRGGASSSFRGGRMGGMSKRIDGYGPPPSKSPFGHHEDKDKKSEDISRDVSTEKADKIKQNQEALAAGIIGKSRQETSENKSKLKPRNKSKGRKEEQESGEFSDGSKRQSVSRSSSQRGGLGPQRDRRERNNSQPIKRTGNFEPNPKKSENKPDPQNLLASAIADISLKNRDEEKSDSKEGSAIDLNGDSDGFQEVKNKKTVKERPKGLDEKKGPFTRVEAKETKKPGGNKSSGVQHLTPQQIQNIPPLMSTPVNPPHMLPPSAKPQYDQRLNNRQTELAPRFAKQKMQKQMQQMMGEPGDRSKVSQVGYGMRENVQMQPPAGSAWDKPLGSQLRPVDHDPTNLLGVSMDGVSLETNTAGTEKQLMGKGPQLSDKSLLDGSSPPVNTIIFENTNFKSAPGARGVGRGASNEKPRKLDETVDNSVFAKPINELLQKSSEAGEPIQMFKEETDMKLDFFGADLTHLTEDKSTKTLCMAKSITTVNSTICNADSLNMKIASVKKVWETSEQENEDGSGGISFGTPLDTAFKGSDAQEEHHEGFSPSGGPTASSTNVCKVKPTQQVSTATGQNASSVSQQPHSAMVGHAMLLGTPLSPPPLQATPVGVALGPPPYTGNQHLTGFPTAAAQNVGGAGSAQYGISAIPSPPTVLYNSTQQLQSGLYGAFLPTAEQAGVMGTQGHARAAGGFGQYQAAGQNSYLLGQHGSSHYNAQSVFLQTAPHPPPTAQPPEMYPSMNSFRLSAGPFGQNQGLNNPTGAPATVLISSTSNSLMSASVKPSSQPISAIGTKAGGVGQAYQQQSQQGQQVFMAYEPALQAANYLQGAGVMQRGPTGPPVQNNVVPGLQPSSSYYSGSTGGQSAYYQQPGNSSLGSAPQLPQHQAGYGLQGNIFGTHSQSNTGLQNSFPFLSTQMQVAAALNAQQYRSAAAASLQSPYMKVGGSPMSGDQQAQQGGQRPQQLKSPSSQEVLSSVFNTAPQIASPKSNQNRGKHTPQQSSPTSQRKYNFYPSMGGQQNNVQQRYPAPIQRPINFQQQQNMNSMQSNGSNQKHNRNNSNKAPNRQYYGGQGGPMPSSHHQSDKPEDPKMADSATASKSTAADLSAKDPIKDETPVLKE